MNLKSTIFTILKSFSGQERMITVPMAYIEFCGDCYPTAVMLSQLVFWSDKTKVKHKGKTWIVKTDAEWHKETRLSGAWVKKAAKNLETIEVLETCLKKFGNSPKKHYHLNAEKFTEQMMAFLQKGESKLQDIKQDKIRKKTQAMISTRLNKIAEKQEDTEDPKLDLSSHDKSNLRTTTNKSNPRTTTKPIHVPRQNQSTYHDKTMDLSSHDESIPVEVKEDIERRGYKEEDSPPSFSVKKIDSLTAYMCLQNEEMQIKFISDGLKINYINDSIYFKTLEDLQPLIEEFCTELATEQRDYENARATWNAFGEWVGSNQERCWHKDFEAMLRGRYSKTTIELSEIKKYYIAHVKSAGKPIANWQAGLEKAVMGNWGQKNFKKTASDKEVREKKYTEAKTPSAQSNSAQAQAKASKMKNIQKGLIEGDYGAADVPVMLQGMTALLDEIAELMAGNPAWQKSVNNYKVWVETQSSKVQKLNPDASTTANNAQEVITRLAKGKSTNRILKAANGRLDELIERLERSLELFAKNPTADRIAIITQTIGQLTSKKNLSSLQKTKFTELRDKALEVLKNTKIEEQAA